MQLAHAAGIQAHVDAGDVLGDAEFAHRDLAGPAAGFRRTCESGEREAQIGQACRDRSKAERADRDSAGRARDCAGRDRCRHVPGAAAAAPMDWFALRRSAAAKTPPAAVAANNVLRVTSSMILNLSHFRIARIHQSSGCRWGRTKSQIERHGEHPVGGVGGYVGWVGDHQSRAGNSL